MQSKLLFDESNHIDNLITIKNKLKPSITLADNNNASIVYQTDILIPTSILSIRSLLLQFMKSTLMPSIKVTLTANDYVLNGKSHELSSIKLQLNFMELVNIIGKYDSN